MCALESTFSADTAADRAVRELLLELLKAIEANHLGSIENTDIEFLHDFRVAVRRTRTALGQLGGVFPESRIGPFRTELSWLGHVTGPRRDLDVFRMQMPAYSSMLPESVRADLDPVRRRVDSLHAVEQARLAAELGGERYRRLIDSWRDFLSTPTAEAERPGAARASVLVLAGRRIAVCHRKVLRGGRAIADDSPAEALHRLRIRCKKLRYLLEFFRSLYPERRVGSLIRTLKQLQDNLGDFHDHGVQRQLLTRLGGELRGAEGDVTPSLLALARLQAELESDEAIERRRFARRFAEFSADKTTERFRTLCANGV